MNISLSYNWLKEYIKTNKSAKDFAREFSLYSMSVERVKELKPVWKKVVTAKILEIKPHPQADKLRLATVYIKTTRLTVVCGAPNIQVGQVVPLVVEGGEVVGPPGTSHQVKKANIRGIDSHGMLCSQKELGMGEDHAGIMILPDTTPIGVPLESVVPCNDAVMDFEVTSNRPDCMSVIGLAREASAIFKKKMLLKAPKPDMKIPKSSDAKKYKLKITVANKNLCPRYQAVVMEGVKVENSPPWMQTRLMQAGIRPINNIVDITNYVMLEYGQPMHAFDVVRIAHESLANKTRIRHELHHKCVINVRLAKRGEKILALDGREYELSADDLVIADAQKPIAIAGVMGGEHSSVINSTKTIIFESANFDPVSVRKTSRRLGLVSESSNIFEKGISPISTKNALMRAVELCQKYASGKVASKVYETMLAKPKVEKVKLTIEHANKYLGITLTAKEIKSILAALGFDVTGGGIVTATVPWWRARDVQIPEDIIEEIARMHGYHKIPSILPTGAIPYREKDAISFWSDICKDKLCSFGFTEVYAYSMVSKKVLGNLYVNPEKCLKINNPLNVELEYMRPTLLGGIMEAIERNQENFPNMKMFELSKVYIPRENELPEEKWRLSGAIVGIDEAYVKVKGIVESLLCAMGIDGYSYLASKDSAPSVWTNISEDLVLGNQTLGRIGFVDKKALLAFGVKREVCVFNLDFSHAAALAISKKNYIPLPEFPVIVRDLALVKTPSLRWKELEGFIIHFHPLIQKIEYLSTYRGKELGGKESLALRLVFSAKNRTLKAAEADGIVKNLIARLGEKFGVRLR